MKGYDFDKTIYKTDSSTDFFKYMLIHRPYLLLFAPWFLVVFALYGMKILSKKRTKECLFFFVPWHSNIEKIVNKFWEKHANKIQNVFNRNKFIILSAKYGSRNTGRANIFFRRNTFKRTLLNFIHKISNSSQRILLGYVRQRYI